MIVTLTPAEAAAILREHGMKTSPEKIKAGLLCGVYPFGVCIQMRQKEYEIYKPLLIRWIAEREEEAVACSGSGSE